MSVIAPYMDQNWALHEEQIGFDDADHRFFSGFESQLKMIGHRPTYWSNTNPAC